jgi:Kazal-type serine protease inhibitor domain
MSLTARGITAAAAAMAAVAMTVSACVIEEAPPARPQFCPQIYAPVCAKRGGQVRTFDNECMARGNGYRVISQGQCGAGRPLPPPTPMSDRICPQIYAPVCAVRNGKASTYDNECIAGGQGARVIDTGPC